MHQVTTQQSGTHWQIYVDDELYEDHLPSGTAANKRAAEVRRAAHNGQGDFAPGAALGPPDPKAGKAADGVTPIETIEATWEILDGSIGDLKAELDQGLHDGHLVELLAAEVSRKNRVGAKRAIEARREVGE